jgi:hypothetical protein
MIHAQHIGPIEAQIHAHYGKVEMRVGKYPAKRPIVMPETLTKKPVSRGSGSQVRYDYDEPRIKQLWESGFTMSGIAKVCGIPRKPMITFINKQKKQWECEA